eukprot:gb/GECG01013852.1/.p1 GENE.gb/GECG01013852.1/~~gb/GECG01013852.1/.p1  ORF type:complete len:907 (+),score=108.72 gb/GECG01013852.1/:1-2721(+)
MSLEFHDSIFSDLLRQDGLVVMAPGLGIEAIVRRFLGFYAGTRTTSSSSSSSLQETRQASSSSVPSGSRASHKRSKPSSKQGTILVLNATHLAEAWKEALLAEGLLPSMLPSVITSDVSSVSERKTMYETARCILITSRICIVDFLTERLDPTQVSGILVYNAHLVSDTSSEGFILRIFRQKHPEGFVKAFSDNPVSLASGFNKLEKVLRALHVRKLMLWPRFHVSVSKELEKNPPEVIEISQPLSNGQHHIQRCVIDAMDTCITELRKMVSVDLTELTVENNLFGSFDSRLRRLLDPLWNKMSQNAKQLVTDLRTLRELLFYLAHFDAVSFFLYLQSVRKAGVYQNHPSPWLYTDAAEKVFYAARRRMYHIDEDSKRLHVTLEHNGKWRVLFEVLQEVKEQWHEISNSSECPDENYGSTVVIACEDRTAARQLSRLISSGPSAFLRSRWYEFLKNNRRRTEQLRKAYYDPDRKEALYVSLEQTLLWDAAGDADAETAADEQTVPEGDVSYIAEALSRLNVTVVSVESGLDLIKELRPTFLILYDPTPSFVRLIEVYKAEVLGIRPLRVYFLLYEKSVEEHCYLASLRTEQEAFEKLIQTKAHMTIPAGTPEDNVRRNKAPGDGIFDHGSSKGKTSRKGHKDEEDMWDDLFVRAASGDSRLVSSRSQNVELPKKILVDMREFRSKLPSLLHQAGLEILPITLEVGDYILSPEICVERKSVSDLFGSLASGRLLTQGTAMTRNYKKPLLLIEWESDKAFGLVNERAIPDEIIGHHVHSRIVQLVQTFPTLRLIWTRSPHATVDTFSLLKEKQEEPDANAAVQSSIRGDETDAVESEDTEKSTEDNRNLTAIDILLSLPGVNAANSGKILGVVDSLAELCTLSKATLEKLIGKIHSNELYTFLHHDPE